MKASDLCLDCGLCCNGTLWPGVFVEESKHHLFKWVEKREVKWWWVRHEAEGWEQGEKGK